jgi:hypothetical protein
VPVSGLCKWLTVPNAQRYKIDIASDSLFKSVVFGDDSIPDTSWEYKGLGHSSTYFWRVKGVNASSLGAWSLVRHFMTAISPPSGIKLIHPICISADSSIVFLWARNPSATKYRLWLADSSNCATDSLPSSPLLDDSTITDTSKTIRYLVPGRTYLWSVAGWNASGWGAFAPALQTPFVTAIIRTATPPLAFALEQNYPNPFNPVTTIRYAVPHRSQVVMNVYNTLGQKVAELVKGEVEAGIHEVKFDGKNLASGVYFYRLQAGNFVQTKKLLLLR